MRLALALLLLVAAQVHAADAHAILWSVRGEHNTVYLAGSMHFLPAAEQLPPAMLTAYRDAEKLVMELDMDDLNPADVQLVTLQQGMLPPDESLEEQLGADAFARVNAQAQELGLDTMVLQRMRPWLAALTLTQLQLSKLGWSSEAGVEQRFVQLATADRKQIVGLESLPEQVELLASLSSELQRQFVLYSVDDADALPREVEQLTRAWREGDDKELQALFEDGFRKYPKLYEPLTIVRNRAWMGSIEPLLKQRDDYLIVVGAAHLVGRDSVVDLLRRRGFTVVKH
ncbi:MAG: TraB/GumN family protein [Steroidobacteraceae bacterium]